MERKLTARVSKEGEWYLARAVGVDVIGQGASKGEAVANLWDNFNLRFDAPLLNPKRSFEDVFGDIQGRLTFHEDPDAPTIDEWEGLIDRGG